MKRLLVTVSVALLAFMCWAAVVVYDIPSPGSTGMVSNLDYDAGDLTSARYLLNADAVKTPGGLNRRKGIKTVGSNDRKAYGATSVFDPTYRWKHIVGVSDTTISSHATGWLYSSDSFALSLSTPLSGNRPVYLNTYHDWLSWQGMVIHADGKSLPTLQVSLGSDSVGYWSDTIKYDRRNVPVEAPGQLRATPLTTSDSKKGYYEYRYRFKRNPAVGNLRGSPPGLATPIIRVDGQRVMLTLFAHNPSPDSLGTQITHAIIERRKVTPFESVYLDSFYIVDTITYDSTQSPIYIDSLSDATVRAKGVVTTASSNIPPAPGAPVLDTTQSAAFEAYACGGSICPGNYSTATNVDSSQNYMFRMSYYDPVTNVESPMGIHSVAARLYRISGTDTMAMFVKWPYIKNTTHGEWIRLYRNVMTTGVAGAGDTNVWYCVGTFRANRARIFTAVGPCGSSTFYRVVNTFFVSDIELATGVTEVNASSPCGSFASYRTIQEEETVVDDNGDVLVRPPLIGGFVSPFSDMEYANGRFWACGDPLFPQRAYFSEIDAPNDWNANSYLSVYEDANDQLIACEKIGYDNSDVLYLFKHNGIYAATGTDPEYDMQLSTVNNSVGALSRQSTIKADDAIYFVSPNLRMYKLTNQDFSEVGFPVRNWIESVFVSYAKAVDSVRCFKLGETVNWINIANNKILTYNFYAGQFSMSQFQTGFIPIGSFTYDTAQTRAGFNYYADFLFRSDSAKPFRTEYTALVNVDSTASNRYVFPFSYQTPFFGDGNKLVQIWEVQLEGTGTSSGTAIATVYNHSDVVVATDTLTFDGRTSQVYNFGIKPHIGRQVSLRITTSDAILAFKLSGMRIKVREVSRERS